MSNSALQEIGLIVSILAVIVIPFMIALIRITIKWTRIEERLNELTADMKELVENKDIVHSDIINTMSNDREATNRRLRWVEEHIWKGSRNAL